MFRRLSSVIFKRPSIPKQQWSVPNICAMSTFKARSEPSRNNQVSKINVNLISRRFFHQQRVISKGSLSWTKVLAAVGAVLGIGTGGNLMQDKPNGILQEVLCQDDDFRGCIEKKCEDSPCLRQNECEEKKIIQANADLEKALKVTKGKAMEYTEAAMKAYCEAIKIVQEYLNQGYCLIDSDQLEPPSYEESWCCVYGIAKKRCEKVKEAIQKGQCAWELLCRLREIIETGKACKYTSCNPLLVTAEESLLCAERELLNLKCQLDCVGSESELVEQFKDVLENFKKDLQADVNNVPEDQKCKIQYVEQEMALMIEQAYLKVIRTHKEMAQVLVCKGALTEKQKETTC